MAEPAPNPAPERRGRARLAGWPGAALVLALSYLLAYTATLPTCNTADELPHIAAGYAYWVYNDYRFQPENGNLPQRLAPLPLLAGRYAFPAPDELYWPVSSVWFVGRQFLFERGNDADAIVRRCRAATGLLLVAAGALVFGWSRSLFGTGPAWVSLVAWCG